MRLYHIFIAILIASAAVIITTNTCYGQNQKGVKSVGLKSGYTSKNESAIAGLYFQYQINTRLRLAPSVDYTFRHYDCDAYALNINLHVPFSLRSSQINAYPIVGLNYTSWNHIQPHSKYTDWTDGSILRTDRIGANVGAGAEIYATPTLKFCAEANYCFIKQYSTAIVSLSIGYVF